MLLIIIYSSGFHWGVILHPTPTLGGYLTMSGDTLLVVSGGSVIGMQ